MATAAPVVPSLASYSGALGVETSFHACDADGLFLHEPEPTETNLREIGPLVAKERADIGFALDPDSDRLALLDETGHYLGEELTLALAVWFRLSRERGPVVVNMSTSRVTADLAAKYGCVCHRSAVGEANVADKMLAVGAVIGGEVQLAAIIATRASVWCKAIHSSAWG